MIYLVIVGVIAMQHEAVEMNKPSLHTKGQFILYLQGLCGHS